MSCTCGRTKALPKDVKCLRYVRILSENILDILYKFYPDNHLATRDLTDGIKPYYKISRLSNQGYLEKIDAGHVGARYGLTIHGKCGVLCHKLDIPFLCLYILTEAYSLHKEQVRYGCSMSYVIQDIKDIFGGIYTDKTITNAASFLHTKKYTFHRSRDTIQIYPEMMKKLKQYDAILGELHRWIGEVPTILNRISLKD